MKRESAAPWTWAIGFAVALVAAGGCAEPDGTADERVPLDEDRVRAEVEAAVREAYDISRPGVDARMLALYADSGRVVSAFGGRVTTSRDTLEQTIRYFWENVGSNMRNPRWVWDAMYTDVLSPTAAVVTATYHIPHLNPRNQPHVLGGAMTLVLVRRDGRWRVIQEHLSDLPQTTNAPDPSSAAGNP